LTWLKIGDEFLEDETIGALRDRTFRLHVKGLVYCARNNTDGHLSERAVKMLQALLGFQVKTNVAELVGNGPVGAGGRGDRDQRRHRVR
jgi:hypothetical protein